MHSIVEYCILTGILLVTFLCLCPRMWFTFPEETNPYERIASKSISQSKNNNLDAGIVTYYITKKGGYGHTKIDLKTIQSDNPDIDKNATWFFGVHGWTANHTYSPIHPTLIDAIHYDGPANIIHVDWEEAAVGWHYTRGQENCKLAASEVADVINGLVSKGLAEKQKIRAIGYSMGGHFVGFIGKYLYAKYGWKPDRITALEPTSLLYEDQDADGRIDSEDGEYVEIIHSCGDIMGIWEPFGHVDIYLNTGRSSQPGCDYWSDIHGSCSHSFSVSTYTRYTNLAMEAYRCSSFEDFGRGHCNEDFNTTCTLGFKYANCKEGIYRLDTRKYFHP